MKRGAVTAGMVTGPFSKEEIVCTYPHMVSSDGVWYGDDPFDFAAPVFLVQITIFFFASRFIFVLLKPLRQSIITAQVLVSSSLLGGETYVHLYFMAFWTPLASNSLNIIVFDQL
jgi:hypothetical protein